MKPNLLVSEVREVMDLRQAALYLGISADTLYTYAAQGKIPAFKLGNRWRFKRSRIDGWMDHLSGIEQEHKETELRLDIQEMIHGNPAGSPATLPRKKAK